MHNMTKKSLLTKYGALAKEGATAVEIKNAITQAKPELSIEEVDEVVLEIFDDPSNDPEEPKEEAAAPAAAPIPTKSTGIIKKKYDIWKGKWVARKVITGPDGKDMVLEWEFMREGKAKRTGVPMEPEKADIFNHGKRLRLGNTLTEQMIESGYAGRILDTLPNPYQIREVTNFNS